MARVLLRSVTSLSRGSTLALLVLLGSCASAPDALRATAAEPTAAAPTPAPELARPADALARPAEARDYSVRFTQNQHGRPESSCERPICRELLAEVAAAQATIDFALYGIRAQDQILGALVAAQARGVVVRGVVDAEDGACTRFEYADTARLIAALRPGSVRCDSGPGFSEIMHDKFLVFDRAAVWTGSTNISDTELGGELSSDVAALLRSPALAAIYTREVEEMLGGRFHRRKAEPAQDEHEPVRLDDGTTVRVYFSPTDRAVERAVVPLIDAADATLDIAMFFFTSKPAADAVVRARDRGVAVRMILDASGAGNASSKHRRLCEAGALVKVETWAGKSHAKWAVADAADPSAAVVLGSMNWTDAGDSRNDENTLHAQGQAFASPFHVEFERQWSDLSGVAACRSPRLVAGAAARRGPARGTAALQQP